MNEPARRLPDPHAAEPSITGVTGVSGVHTKAIRLPAPRPESLPPPLARFILRPLPDASLSDAQLMVSLMLIAPMVALATYLTLETLSPREPAKASFAKVALSPVGNEQAVETAAMFVDLGEETAPAAEASPSDVRELPDLDEPSAAELLANGDRFRSQGHHGRARHNYGLALRSDPDNRWAMAGLIRSHLAQGHVARAREWTLRLRRESPRWATSHILHGDVLTRSRDVRGARTAYQRALQLAPRNAEARRKLTEVANPY